MAVAVATPSAITRACGPAQGSETLAGQVAGSRRLIRNSSAFRVHVTPTCPCGVGTSPVAESGGGRAFVFPPDALYVVLE